jgi:stringent starvation protein B
MTNKSEKQKNLNNLLDSCDYVLVHLNPKNKDLIVPEYLCNDPSLTLKLSRYFRGKLDISEEQISAELLFGGKYFTCKIPFDAIWGCTSEKGENFIWPENTPEDVLKSILETAIPASSEKSVQKENITNVTTNNSNKKAKRPNHLRRVK